ncbi:hypothetical protein NUACC21_42050 [Scytonema sp. NUACC21]
MVGFLMELAVGLFSVAQQDNLRGNTALFNPGPKPGLFYGGGLDQLLIQLLGIFCVGIFTVVFSWFVWSAIKVTVGLRVSPEAELNGLDISLH